MRIVAAEFRQLQVPYGPDGYEPSWLPGVTQHVFPQTLVRLFSDEGHVGISSTNSFGHEVLEANRRIAPLFLGRRLDSRENLRELWSEITDRVGTIDEQSLLGITLEEARKSDDTKSIQWMTVLWNLLREPGKIGLFRTKNIRLENRFAYLDVALWDLLGKKKNRPVAELLGKKRDRIKAYVSTGEVISRKMLDFARDCRREGMESIKFRVNDPDPSGREFTLLREGIDALGPEFQVGVDANQGWSLLPPYWSREQALRAGRELENLGVDWLEEPLGCRDVEGLESLSDALGLEVVGGELESGEKRFRELLAAYDTFNPDVCMSTGFSGGMTLGNLALENGLGYTPHTWDLGPGVAAGVQLACALETCNRLEYPMDPSWPVSYRDSILASTIDVENGDLVLPGEPGLGVDLDMDAVRDSTVRTVRLGEPV